MKVLVVGYWVWFGISTIVLSRRLILRVTRGPKAGTGDATPAGAEGSEARGAIATGEIAHADVAARVAARLAAHAPEAPVSPLDEVDAPDADVTVPDVTAPDLTVADAIASEAPSVVDAPAPATLAGTVFAPRPPAPTRSSLSGARTSLAEVLRGMAMPADLAPLVHVAGADMTRRAVFCTNGPTLEHVGAEVAEELLRLGFLLEPTSPTDALARRGDETISVRVRAIGPQPPKGPADPAYPTAPAGSVVLDVELA